jgi:hypothetical protein
MGRGDLIRKASKKQNGASKRGAAPLQKYFPFPPGRGLRGWENEELKAERK